MKYVTCHNNKNIYICIYKYLSVAGKELCYQKVLMNLYWLYMSYKMSEQNQILKQKQKNIHI